MSGLPSEVEAWRARGHRVTVRGHDLFVVDVPAAPDRRDAPPLVALHGFPTSSWDWAPTIDALAEGRRVVAPDLLGFGLSAKPDQPYLLTEQADLVQSLVVALGLDVVDLLTHDMGDSVGGELLARELDGELPFRVRRRVLANGSIYLRMADLRWGQHLLMTLPARRLPFGLPSRLYTRGLGEVFAPGNRPGDAHLAAQWALMRHDGGDRLLPRLMRYLDERRRREERFTGAIERHPAPVRVVWGADDPVALLAMAHELVARRGGVDDATDLVVLDGVGHFPMLEAPDRLAALVTDWLDAP